MNLGYLNVFDSDRCCLQALSTCWLLELVDLVCGLSKWQSIISEQTSHVSDWPLLTPVYVLIVQCLRYTATLIVREMYVNLYFWFLSSTQGIGYWLCVGLSVTDQRSVKMDKCVEMLLAQWLLSAFPILCYWGIRIFPVRYFFWNIIVNSKLSQFFLSFCSGALTAFQCCDWASEKMGQKSESNEQNMLCCMLSAV